MNVDVASAGAVATAALERQGDGAPSVARETVRALARAGARATPARVTSASVALSLIACLAVVWSAEHVFIGQIHGGRTIGYLAFGALPNGTVAGRGSPDQWWRYFTSALVHERAAPVHLTINIAALALIGPRAERLYGKLVFVACFALASASGGMAWMVWSALGLGAVDDYSAGASAGVCGLLGLLLAFGYRTHATMELRAVRSIKAQAALGVAMIALLGLVVPNLNNAAHAGGLLCGLVMGLCLPPIAQAGGRRLRRAERAVLLTVVVASTVALAMAGQNLAHRLLEH